ncbi:oligopeptide/dipeptide ABC transporter ATP-binding protein [Bradyrhizobium cosmicum]|uniref:oligopeptide/dipeptide ABC transporter ATP-binding protein n=1 Tax=Bradyrhizobium cosmicum TaxID=1404864 RepID=UPI0028E1C4C8|nr:oligopeptide/dipeptide ABC transporter ATP-binding protein [Bradyrhizobium cosmicum]
MSFLAFVLRRLALLAPALLGVSVIGFLLVYLLPANPALVKAGAIATAEYVAEMQHRMRLDQPLYAQYEQYMSALPHGDLGEGSSTGRAVFADFMQRLPATFELTLASLLLAVLFGVPLVVAVMYLGVIVEEADAASLFVDPRHPYTCALLPLVPVPDPAIRRERFVLKGEIPSPTAVHVGCLFRARRQLAKPAPSQPRDGNSLQLITSPLRFGLTDANKTGKKHISLGQCRHSQGPAPAALPIGQPVRPSSSSSRIRPQGRMRRLVRDLATGSARRKLKPLSSSPLGRISCSSAAGGNCRRRSCR